MDENVMNGNEIQLSTIPKTLEFVRKELDKGNLVSIRADKDFLYIIDRDDKYKMFTHTAGTQEAGKRDYEKDDRIGSLINGMLTAANAAYTAEFGPELNLYSVMAAMESGILSRYPEADTDEGASAGVVEGEGSEERRVNKAFGRRKDQQK